jgi:hypothetical protein
VTRRDPGRCSCTAAWSAAALFGLGAPSVTAAAPADGICTVQPEPTPRALRNPLKGFTARGIRTDHPWVSLVHHYIRWNEIENAESDGIEKIRAYCNAKWKGLPERNIKVIPRVYLHWSGDRKYWPADLKADDYTSGAFRKRVLRLVDRIGRLWDGDPRVAFVELGIFGKWGEHHSPSPTPDMQKLVGGAFAKAFTRKRVSVRHAWNEFTDQPFGEYWDSFAHYQQMYAHGKPIADLNARTGRWKTNYIGGETAYDWGLWKTQPGETPTDSVAKAVHRDFVIHTIRWLHCTQVRWIADYDRKDPRAAAGAEAMQKAFGYRFVLEKVSFPKRVMPPRRMRVSLTVRNVGAAPFYYDWPVEAALLDPKSRKVVWTGTFEKADVRTWLPGDGWTEPAWIPIKSWPKKAPKPGWSTEKPCWKTPPRPVTVTGDFALDAPAGTYVLSLAVLDPAGMLPSLRFATTHYLRGGRHPVGLVAIGSGDGGPLPAGFAFDDPFEDDSLRYDGAATPKKR